MLLFYILFNLIAGALGLNVSSGEVIGFELRFDTLTAIGSLEFEPDYCLPTPVASATEINTTGGLTKTQIITETVIQTVFISATSPNPTAGFNSTVPNLNLTRFNSTGIGPIGTIGSLNGILPTSNISISNLTFTRAPIPTIGASLISDGNLLNRNAWLFISILIIGSNISPF
jgi:hypothetical protein